MAQCLLTELNQNKPVPIDYQDVNINFNLPEHKTTEQQQYVNQEIQRKKKINYSNVVLQKETLDHVVHVKKWEQTEFDNQADIAYIGDEYEEQFKRAQTTKLNKIPGLKLMCQKKYTNFGLNRLKQFFPKEYSFIPKNYSLPSNEPEFLYLLEQKEKKSEKYIYIVKPSSGQQGQGIFLITSLIDYNSNKHKISEKSQYIVEEYISNPLIVDNKKFDLRLYLIITNLDPLVAYLYDEGLARFCTEDYEIPNQNNIQNYFMHLTNDNFNIKNSKYVKTDEIYEKNNGTKRTLTSLWKSLQEQNVNKQEMIDNVMDVVQLFLLSLVPILKSSKDMVYGDQKSENFQITGLDILFDGTLKPWFIEINAEPSITTHKKVLNEIQPKGIVDVYTKTNLLADTINIACLPIEEQLKLDQFQNMRRIKVTHFDVQEVTKLYDSLYYIYKTHFGPEQCINFNELIHKVKTILNIQENISIQDFDPYYYLAPTVTYTKLLRYFTFIQIIEEIAFTKLNKINSIDNSTELLLNSLKLIIQLLEERLLK